MPAHHVVVGTPAKSVRIKPGFEERAKSVTEKLTSRQDEREISYELPPDLDQFDEFGRMFEPEDRVK